jgi:cell division protein FtsW
VKRRAAGEKKGVDKTLFYLTLVLTFLGLLAVTDASAPQALHFFNDKFYFAKQQIMWAGIGIVVMLFVSKIHFSLWEKLAIPLFLFSLISLIVVLIPAFGTRLLGARRWIFAGPFSFQPSELVKLTIALYLAKVATGKKSFISYFLPVALVAGLIMLQPDLGTAVVVVALSFSQIFVSGLSLVYFLLAGGAGIIISFLLIITSEYRRARLLTFLSQSQDPLRESYHIRQVLLALGSGGLFGVGLGQSREKFLFLPEAASDSIFAIIAEEVGFFGSLAIILLFALFIWRGLRIAALAPDKFSSILALGLTSWIGFQAFFNLASMVVLTPLTGVPLPFFSYGGSSLVMILSGVGILLNISQYAKK